jgi:hypothetical protein
MLETVHSRRGHPPAALTSALAQVTSRVESLLGTREAAHASTKRALIAFRTQVEADLAVLQRIATGAPDVAPAEAAGAVRAWWLYRMDGIAQEIAAMGCSGYRGDFGPLCVLLIRLGCSGYCADFGAQHDLGPLCIYVVDSAACGT